MFQDLVRLSKVVFDSVLNKNKQLAQVIILPSSKFSSMVKGHQRQSRGRDSSSSLSSSRTIKSSKSLSSLLSSMTNNLTTISGPNKMKVYPIKALQDNYMYLLVDGPSRQAAAVDPVNASSMANAVAEYEVELKCILTTHHHYDHAHGNSDMVSMFPDIIVYGGDQRVQALTKPVTHGEILKLGSLTIECLSTPCHTRGHICYYVHNEEPLEGGVQSFSSPSSTSTNIPIEATQTQTGPINNSEFPASPPLQASSIPVERVVFTGDTLFIAGCGRFFEGTSEQMDQNLNTILGNLPPETRVYCGHEYTVANLKFALTVEPQNSDIKMKLDWAQNKVARHEPTVPSSIGEEKRINPFMRLSKTQVRKYTKEQSDIEVMSVLRQKKNEFVP